ncbi:hypothetical protein M9978_08170 [Sphingomonas sp. MG17]|uniref:Uncharacterized protein n=1 Tax=Sphingomonas tagetis TaxID=2949092 RepID=A0A9X2HIS5_9SPHN|nr:hypothetical protein [Sphingomonas tagetis]MCP3730402.1 hypothetical protein [Sphingomonas tagetis]
MTARRRHLCDTPGCGMDRKRWQRLCQRCFAALPPYIRVPLILAHKERRTKDWRVWKRKAGEALAANIAQRGPSIDSRTAYENTARLLGER